MVSISRTYMTSGGGRERLNPVPMKPFFPATEYRPPQHNKYWILSCTSCFASLHHYVNLSYSHPCIKYVSHLFLDEQFCIFYYLLVFLLQSNIRFPYSTEQHKYLKYSPGTDLKSDTPSFANFWNQNYLHNCRLVHSQNTNCLIFYHHINLLVIMQKDESQNRCFMKTMHVKFSKKQTFLTP